MKEKQYPIKNVLVDVQGKDNLSSFIEGLIQINPSMKFITATRFQNIIKSYTRNLIDIVEYTNSEKIPRDAIQVYNDKIQLGILARKGNKKDDLQLKENKAYDIDMVISNICTYYNMNKPKKKAKLGEIRRIDQPKHKMIWDATINYEYCAIVAVPGDYKKVLEHMLENKGCIDLELREYLCKKSLNKLLRFNQNVYKFAEQCLKKEKEINDRNN